MNAAALDSIWDASAWNFHHPCQSITPPTSDWSVVRSKKLSWKSLTPLKTATSWKILKTFATFPTNLAASPFPERFEDMLIFEMQFPCQRQGSVSSSYHWIGNKIFCAMYYITLYIEPGSPLWIGKNAAVAIQRWPGWPRFPTGNQREAACTSKVAQHQASYPSSSSSFSWKEDDLRSS